MMNNLKGRGEIKNLSLIMDIVEMHKYIPAFPFANKPESSRKNIGYREFSTRRISLHRGCRKKWDVDMKFVWSISHKPIEKGKLSEKVIYISKISNIGDFLSMDFIFILEKYPRPAIRKLLKAYYFWVGNFSFKVRKMRMKKSKHFMQKRGSKCRDRIAKR